MSVFWEILFDWWFGIFSDVVEVVVQCNGLWFGKNVCQDVDVGGCFGDLVNQVLDGGLQEWMVEVDGWLVLILLFDQLLWMIYCDMLCVYVGDVWV